MPRSLPIILLVAVGCRQMLDLEPARLDSAAADASAGDTSASGAEALPQAGGGGSAAPGGGGGGDTNEPDVAGAGASAANAAGGMPPSAAGGAGGTQDSSGGDGSLPEPPLCEQYCGAMEANCTGNLVQYSDYQTCIDTCEQLPRGHQNDAEVNTVHCRLAEADKAGRLEPEFYCPLAGPASAGKCGTSCDAYCDIMQGFCTSQSTSGLYFYADKETCLAECALLPPAGEPYSAALHSIGPHFECRLFHACASNIDAEYHCGHAFGDPPCNGP